MTTEQIREFKDALHIFFTKAEVNDFNHVSKRDLGTPVVELKADHHGPNAAECRRVVRRRVSSQKDVHPHWRPGQAH